MIKTSSLLAKLAKRFPKRLAKEYHDYVGLMVGPLPEYIDSIYLALDFDDTVYDEAREFHPDLIITHHPFIYGTRARIRKNDPEREALIKRVESDELRVYSMHTNFDRGVGGMNDALAEALDLQDITPLINDPMARGGALKTPLSVEEAAKYAKKRLKATYGLLLPYGKKTVSRIAIVGGGGSKSHAIAMDEGYDLYISGDAPHHVRRSIINRHYNYLDLPHEIESIFMDRMEKILHEIDPTLTIKKAPRQSEAQPI
ncbi:MAG: Nif3-like dinuclear metal center hexameric protein [Bacilli bacterium]|jgi:dinuclear metal center YbgI/SA1388 family protein